MHIIKISPAIRISLGLVFITISVLLFGNLIGLVPDRYTFAMQARKTVAESVAVQCSLAAQDNNFFSVKETMAIVVSSQPDILSMGLRGVDGNYLTQSDNHHSNWISPPKDKSTSTHWQIPILKESNRWGTLEISFAPLSSFAPWGYQVSPFYLFVIFFACVTFIGFTFFMKRTLRHLDPTTVMPSRVKKMLDTLTEGVILIDNNANIILANTEFAKELGVAAESLMGMKISKLDWLDYDTKGKYELQPWADAMTQKQTIYNVQISLSTKWNSLRTYQANFSPILDDNGFCRGALATLDDVTEMENKNIQLHHMLEELNKSQTEVMRQNAKLEILATQDPLTGCLNRRAFFEKARILVGATHKNRSNLSCVMADLDFFKKVNDNFGHSVGDQVIKFFADILLSSVKGGDAVCRYGGEEFCVLLPNCDIDNAFVVTDKIRSRVEKECTIALSNVPGIKITGSFGVSSLSLGAKNIEELIEQSDKALYSAKEEGRNRVVRWKSV